MALYTPPSLPRTPPSCAMTTTLPSLPAELLASWSVWRPKATGLITPPLSTALPRPAVTSLPPITHLDRQLSVLHPITPPLSSQDASHWSRPAPVPSQHTAQRYANDHDDADIFEPPLQQKPFMPEDAPHLIDWLDSSLKRPTSFIAEKTCEMVCYLWFASSVQTHGARAHSMPSPPYSPGVSPSTSALQLAPSPAFVQFMQKLLETTQVSQSVIVLSLHYIWRLKERNQYTTGLPGSEFRIAVAALMMANKFLDDNTYTNKTWSEVSGIDLSEINRMEREFLLGVDFSLHISGKQYASWLNLLKGLVLAKETESRKWRGIRARYSRSGRQSQAATAAPTARTYRWRCQSTTSYYRARSTSPVQYTYPRVCASYHVTPPTVQYSPSPNPGSKRSAADAFSPTSASFKELPPLKRPTGMTLQIPENSFSNGPNSVSPLDSLHSFAKMSLSSSSPHPSLAAQSTLPRPTVPHTLVAAYRADRPVNVPRSLYYYSLAGSSTDEAEYRKSRLRCYQPPPPTATGTHPHLPSYRPVDVQSASVSPRVSPHGQPHTHGHARQALPHSHDPVWARTRRLSSAAAVALATSHAAAVAVGAVPTHKSSPAPGNRARSSLQLPPLRGNGIVPSAPFANAGPPGVHFYAATPTTTTCQYHPASGWPHGR